ncbi:MAG: thioredoxin family protein [Acetatifactor sp.]|nr:thioredoxin family protein [Acetatifactor sp.]
MAVRVTKDDFEEKVLRESLPVVVDFYSDSCVACKMLAPVLGELEDEYEEKLKVVKVNTNFDVELSEKYSIMSNPTVLIFQSGEEVARRVGSASYQEFEDWVMRSING